METRQTCTLTSLDCCILDTLRDAPKSTRDLRRIAGGTLSDFQQLREKGHIAYSSLGKKWVIPARLLTKAPASNQGD